MNLDVCGQGRQETLLTKNSFLLFVDSFGWEARELRLLMGSYINLHVKNCPSSESAVNRKLTDVKLT